MTKKSCILYFLILMIGIPSKVFSQSSYNRVVIQTIGVRSPDKPKDLPAAVSLSRYKELVDKFKCYPKPPLYLDPLCDNLRKEDVQNCLRNLVKKVDGSDVVILHILSHGEFDETSSDSNHFYLVCNDKKLNGEDIIDELKEITKKGSLVIFFLDACFSGGLFEGEMDDLIKNGALVFYASSKLDQPSVLVGDTTAFTNTILRTFEKEYVTPDSLTNTLKRTFERNSSQTPEIKYFPTSFCVGDKEIQDFPILKPVTKPAKKCQPYIGIALGYPYASVFAGLSLWQHLKVEIGCSFLNVKESDEVYLYSSNNPSPYGYRYSTNNLRLYLQSGWEFDLGKNWYLTPMVGVSYLSLSGDPIEGYKSESRIGDGTSAVCLTANARLSWAPFRDKHWQLNVNAGKEWGVGDSDYKLIRNYIDHKTIEGFRGQIGITYNF